MDRTAAARDYPGKDSEFYELARRLPARERLKELCCAGAASLA